MQGKEVADSDRLKGYFKKPFTLRGGIVSFAIERAVTGTVAEFYGIAPFPNHRTDDDKASIVERGDRNALSSALKRHIGFNKSFLEVGSGTSQLSNHLAIGTNNWIFAFDPTLRSLKLRA